jgi:ABC-type glycerol-3-phosphate transport system permease component
MKSSSGMTIGRWIFLGVALLMTFFPFYWMFVLATQKTVNAFGEPRFLYVPSFNSFVTVWEDQNFTKSIGMSTTVVLMTVSLSLAVSIPAAFVLTRHELRQRTGVMAWLLIAYLLPDFLIAIPMYALFQNIGLYDTPLGLALAYQVFMTPLSMWLLLRFFQEVPPELGEAAHLDGCSDWQLLTRVYLPLVMPGVATTAILVAITVWNEVTIALALTVNNPTVPIAVASYKGYASISWDQLAAASLFASIPVVLFALIAQRYIVNGLTTGIGK